MQTVSFLLEPLVFDDEDDMARARRIEGVDACGGRHRSERAEAAAAADGLRAAEIRTERVERVKASIVAGPKKGSSKRERW